MKYDELTDEQKADIAAYDLYLRGTLRQLTRVAIQANPSHWNTFATDRVDSLLARLADTETIPNSTGLARAVDLTVPEFRTIQAIARQLAMLMVTHKSLLVKAIGTNAPSEIIV